MSLHFASIGWSFGSRALFLHPLVRAVLLVILWYALPAQRFTALPLAIALLYFATIALLRKELAAFRLDIGGTKQHDLANNAAMQTAAGILKPGAARLSSQHPGTAPSRK